MDIDSCLIGKTFEVKLSEVWDGSKLPTDMGGATKGFDGGGRTPTGNVFEIDDLLAPRLAIGGGAHGVRVPNCATTAESQAVRDELMSLLRISLSFQMGRMEIVLPSILFPDKILKGRLDDVEFEDKIASEFELPINLLLDKLRSDETRGPYETFCLTNVFGSTGRKAEF